MAKNAVVLLNLGGPDSLEAIEPFLYNLFCDPDIFKIPIGQKTIAKIISRKRAPKVAEEYKVVGGNSPINKWTEIQRSNLEAELKKNEYDCDVFTGMRYWNPMIRNVAHDMNNKKYDKNLYY